MPVSYRIGEFSKLTGVSTKTLRFYDEIGLLRPAGINSRTRYRHYLPQQLQDLSAILSLKELGISLLEIRHVMKVESKQERRELLEGLRETVKHSIKTAEQSLCWIDAALKELNEFSQPIPIVVKHRPAVHVASLRTQGDTYTDILPLEQELLHALPAEALGGLRGVLWHRCAAEGSIDGEPFVELKQAVPHKSYYELKQLPPATVACAYSGLEDTEAERAYHAIRRWMKIRGFRLAGAKREIYLGQMLEIQFPIQPV